MVQHDDGTSTLTRDGARECLYADVDDETFDWAYARLTPQLQRRTSSAVPRAIALAHAPVDLRGVRRRPGRAPRSAADHGSPMHRAVEWPLGHSPFANRPELVAELLVDLARPIGLSDPVRERTGGLLPYCIVAGSMSLGYGSIYTLLADLRDRYGFSEAQLGLIVAAGFLAGFVAQLALARLADRGYAPLLVRGGVLLAMAAMIGSAPATQFWAFLLARLLLGLGSGAVGPAIRRIAITRDPDAVGANLGRLAAFDVAGFMLGPLVAAVVAELFGLRAPFVFLAAVFVGVFVLAVRLDLTTGTTDGQHGRALRAYCSCDPRSKRPWPRASRSTSPSACSRRSGRCSCATGAPRRGSSASPSRCSPLPMIFLAPIGGREAQRRGPLRVVSVSLTIATICTFSYGVLPSLWMLLAVSLVHAVADSFTMPSNQVAAALGSPPEHLSAAQGLLGATGLAAAGLTGLVAGYVYEEAGRIAVCTGTAVVMAVFLVIAITLGRRELADTPEMIGTDAPVPADAIGSGVPDLP